MRCLFILTEMGRVKIFTVGINLKAHKCEYEIHSRYDSFNNLNKIEIRLFMEGDSEKEWFDFKLAPIDNDTLKVTDMFIGKESHRMKGIPEALILEAGKIFGKRIISSSDKHPILMNEWRRGAASKVWERLVQKGLAKYNSDKDYYCLI